MMSDTSPVIKRIHVFVLVLGAVLFASVSLNGNVWFDECYSIAAVSHGASSMARVLLLDVHPFLYYVLLKAVAYLTGGSMIAMRLFSALGMWVLALAGYTHVRAHFGERMGLFFSLLCVISPASLKYAGEIRMYSWAAVFVFFSAFYAYLLARRGFAFRRDGILFVIFSVAAAYMHYYGLVSVCVINAFLIGFVIWKKRGVIPVILCAVSELLLYVPGALIFIIQGSRVAASEYWITVEYPEVLLQTMSYSFLGGDSAWDTYMNDAVFVIVKAIGCVLFLGACAVIVYCGLKRLGDASERQGAMLALGVFAGVIACGLIVSIFKEFYYVRYSMLVYGLVLFVLAYGASRIRVRWQSITVTALAVACSVAVLVPYYRVMYNGDFSRAASQLEDAFGEGDVLVYDELTPGSVITYMLPDAEQYYYYPEKESYPRAYAAFSDVLKTVGDSSELPDKVDGSLWVLLNEDGSAETLEALRGRYPALQVTDEFNVRIGYRNNSYRFLICNING